MNAWEKVQAWWASAPEWQRRTAIGSLSAAVGFLVGFIVGK